MPKPLNSDNLQSTKPHICILAPNAFSIISGDKNIKIVGGAELQQVLLAKALVLKGFKVSMICMDHGQADNLEIDGIQIIKAFKPNAGLPVLRFLYPRLSSFWQGMKRANADIYFQSAAGMITGLAVAFCKLHHKKSIFYAAHNADFTEKPTHIKYRRDLWLYHYGVKHANEILTQNTEQQRLCKLMFNRDSIIVPNLYALPESSGNNANGYILWVSTIREFKRPALFVELAKSMPHFHFKMVGGFVPGDEALYENIKTQAESLSNLDFEGFVPYSGIDSYFNGARLVINTSHTEGFPNAFLQAWARKIPTISFFDCGALVDEKPLGFIVDSLENMRVIAEKLMTDDKTWLAQGERSQAYFSANHSIEHAIDQYTDVLTALVNE